MHLREIAGRTPWEKLMTRQIIPKKLHFINSAEWFGFTEPCLTTHLSPPHLSRLFSCLDVCLSLCLPVCLIICLSLRDHLGLSFHPSVSVCLSVFLSVCLLVCLSVLVSFHLSVFLSFLLCLCCLHCLLCIYLVIYLFSPWPLLHPETTEMLIDCISR